MNLSIKATLAMALLSPALGFAACDVRSGPNTAALLELYTSEGCSSCPPADKRLSQFPSTTYGLDQVVPISLHVDYWDYIGWKEPFAQRQFAERQRWLVRANGRATVFTPHFFVSGTEVRDWRGDLGRALQRVIAEPARASIHVRAELTSAGAVSIAGSASATDQPGRLALFAALIEGKLTSKVSAGENRGVTLSHDHVVREWIEPVVLSGGRAALKLTVPARPTWNATRLGIAAFVQDLGTARVLQAVGASQCVG